jgi:hypothetical protein
MIVEENNFVYNRTIQKNRESKEARLYMERYDIAMITEKIIMSGVRTARRINSW